MIAGSVRVLAFLCAGLGSGVALAADAGCDAGRWPLSAVQAQFRGALPAIASGEPLPSLGAPTLVNLAPQAQVAFLHPPGRTGKANPAYAALVKLGPEPAATYQVTVSEGAWVDLVENAGLDAQTGYVRRKDCPGVDKSIRFKTNGGPLTLQISGAYAKAIRIEASRVE